MSENVISSKRSFLGVTAIENVMASSRRRAKGNPSQRLSEPSLTPPQIPQNKGPRIGRRAALVIGGTALGIVILRPWDWLKQQGSQEIARAPTPTTLPENPFMSEVARKLGREINSWRLWNGVSMSATFAEIKQAADLLEGKIDPRKGLQQLGIPIAFVTNSTIQAFNFDYDIDIDSSRKIKVNTNDGREYTLPLIKPNARGAIWLSPDVVNSSLRLPIGAKEASQIVENLDYCKAYVALLREMGTFTLENPENVPTTEDEIVTSFAYLQAQVQMDQTGSAFFNDFLDIGSGLRIGGIAFANWYEDQIRHGRLPSEQDVNINAGLQVSSYLKFQNHITKQGNGMWVWTGGKSPEIGSKEFLKMFNEYTGRE